MWRSVCAVLLVAGCSSASGGPGPSGGAGGGAATGGTLGVGGTLGSGGSLPGTGGGAGTPGDGCSAASRLVYVIDDQDVLHRFDPTVQSAGAFTAIGTVACPGGRPNSMAVGRDGFAYVLEMGAAGLNCRGVFQVRLDDATCLGQTPFVCGSAGFNRFGMGFSTDTVGGNTDSLYIGGTQGTYAFGRLDLATGQVQPLGTMPGGSEFTGNARAELWAFTPSTSPPTMRLLDKTSGAALQTVSLPGLPAYGSSVAYAFAFWGGSFYVFYATDRDPMGSSTSVWKAEVDGTVVRWVPPIGRRIVGAGVSTCAPVVPPS